MLQRALATIRELLDCCELNLDEMEDETRETIDKAEALLAEQKYYEGPRVEAIAVRDSPDEHTSATVSCAKSNEVTEAGELFTVLREAVSEWMLDSEGGKAAWEASSGDFNIGDLALCDDAELTKILADRGIHGLDIQIISQETRGRHFRWSYDAHLFTEEAESELRDREAEEDE